MTELPLQTNWKTCCDSPVEHEQHITITALRKENRYLTAVLVAAEQLSYLADSPAQRAKPSEKWEEDYAAAWVRLDNAIADAT